VKSGDLVAVDQFDLVGFVTEISEAMIAVLSLDKKERVYVAPRMCRPVEFPVWSGTYTLTPSKGHVMMRWRLLVREPVAVYDFQNDKMNPLTFWKSPTEFVRPPRRFDRSDFGSVPTVLQGVVSPICAPRTFHVHDGGYEIQMWETEKGLVRLTRAAADAIIYPGMRAEGCSMYLAGKARAGVAAGSWAVWRDCVTEENEGRRKVARVLAGGMQANNGLPR